MVGSSRKNCSLGARFPSLCVLPHEPMLTSEAATNPQASSTAVCPASFLRCMVDRARIRSPNIVSNLFMGIVRGSFKVLKGFCTILPPRYYYSPTTSGAQTRPPIYLQAGYRRRHRSRYLLDWLLAMIKNRMVRNQGHSNHQVPPTPAEAERLLGLHFSEVTLTHPSAYHYRLRPCQSHQTTGLYLCILFGKVVNKIKTCNLLAVWRETCPLLTQTGEHLSQICAAAMQRGIDPVGVVSLSLASDSLVRCMCYRHKTDRRC